MGHYINRNILNKARAREREELQRSLQGGVVTPLLSETEDLTDAALQERVTALSETLKSNPRDTTTLCDAVFALALLRDRRYALLTDKGLRIHGLQGLFNEHYAGVNLTKTLRSAT